MRSILLVMILILPVAPIQNSAGLLQLGSKLKKKDIPTKSSDLYMTHPSQLRPYVKRIIDGVEYVIAYARKNREIRYVTTRDKNFKTMSGLKVGAYLETSREGIVSYPGWEIRAPITSDGWYPVVGFNGDVTVVKDSGGQLIKCEDMEAGQKMKLRVIGFSRGGN